MVRPLLLASCVIKKENKYLLVQEAKNKLYGTINTHSKGKWSLPHGNVNDGETIEEAAMRELKEETGGVAVLTRLCAIAQGVIDGKIMILSFIFFGENFTHINNQLGGEIKDVQWFSLKEIDHLEKNELTRDNAPISEIIKQIELNKEVQFIEWKQPRHVEEIMKLLEKHNEIHRDMN